MFPRFRLKETSETAGRFHLFAKGVTSEESTDEHRSAWFFSMSENEERTLICLPARSTTTTCFKVVTVLRRVESGCGATWC